MSFEFDFFNYINSLLIKKKDNLKDDLTKLNIKKKYYIQKNKLLSYNNDIDHKKLKKYLINKNLNNIYDKEQIHNITYLLMIFGISCLIYVSGLAYCKIDIHFRKYFNLCLVLYWVLILPLFTNKIINNIIFIYRLCFFIFIIMTAILIEENKCKL